MRLLRERIESPDNDVLFSAASIWEIAIKQQIGRLTLAVAPRSSQGLRCRWGSTSSR